MRRSFYALVGALALVAVGCNSDDTGRTSSQEQTAQNLEAWAKASDGDWNKLTQEQRDTLTKTVGSEESAKKVLEMKAHRPAPVAGGPPAGWKPGAPPPSNR